MNDDSNNDFGLLPDRIHAIALFVYNEDTQHLDMKVSSYDMQNVSFMYKRSVKEAMNAALRFIAERSLNDYSCYKYNQFICTLHRFGKHRLCALSGENYEKRIILQLLRITSNKIVNDNLDIKKIKLYLNNQLKLYQEPKNVDKVTQVHSEISQTKNIMMQNIETIIQRGEKIDSIIEKSEELSYDSKVFFKTTKKMNRTCCVIS